MRRVLRLPDWPLLLGASTLGLALVLAVAVELGGTALSHLQKGSQAQANYWAVLVYQNLLYPALSLILFINLILLLAWLHRLSEAPALNLLALGLSVLALLLAGYAALPQIFIGYIHLDSLVVNRTRYQLGMRIAVDSDYFFVVSRCDRWGISCRADGVEFVNYEERAELRSIQLNYDPLAKALAIATSTRTIAVPIQP